MEGHRRLAAEQARIEAIYRSSSWRLTRPLRGVSRAVREKDFRHSCQVRPAPARNIAAKPPELE